MITINQRHQVAAPESAVAAALFDPDILRTAIPGCRSLRQVHEDTFWAMANIGLMKMRFDIDATIQVKPIVDGFRIAGEVRAGPVKAGEIEADIALAEARGITTVASRTIIRPTRQHSKVVLRAGNIVSRKLTDIFFKRFAVAIRQKAAA